MMDLKPEKSDSLLTNELMANKIFDLIFCLKAEDLRISFGILLQRIIHLYYYFSLEHSGIFKTRVNLTSISKNGLKNY